MWPIAASLVAITVTRMYNRQRLKLNFDSKLTLTLDSIHHTTDHYIDERDSYEQRGDNFKTLSLKDLLTRDMERQVSAHIMVSALIAMCLNIWLTEYHSFSFLSFIKLLASTCAVLIGMSIVAITFAGNWEMNAHQAKRRYDLVFNTWALSFFAVLAIMFAGIYTVVPLESEGSTFVAFAMFILSNMTTMLLVGSIFGFLGLILQIVNLVICQAKVEPAGPTVHFCSDQSGNGLEQPASHSKDQTASIARSRPKSRQSR